MTHERMQLVRHWMERASEALDEAQLMAESQHWNACVNRLHYACFYAVTALLLKRGFSASKHTAVRSLFNRHVVKANLVSREQADLYNDLFDNRRESDYVAFAQFDERQIYAWLPRTRELIGRIEELVASQRGQTATD
jgi:uncharacterized protein (UPF0332 family)